MNVSKISLPSDEFLIFYYWFLHSTSIITGIISPFYFYIIFTQSKGLNNFKWFLINQSFWGFMFEIFFGFLKITFLTPAFALTSLTTMVKENGTNFIEIIMFISIMIFAVNYWLGFIATILNRYFLTFPLPSLLQKFMSSKYSKPFHICCFSFTAICLYLFIAFLAQTMLSTNVNEMLQNAMKYDSFFENFNDPSLIFLSSKWLKQGALLIFLIFVAASTGAITLIFFFTFLVKKNLTTSVSKVQASLIFSISVQLGFSVICMGIPLMIISSMIIFEIHNSSEITCLCFCAISLHCILEFSATLYLVIPYRKYILLKLKNTRNPSIITPVASAATNTTSINYSKINPRFQAAATIR